MEFINQTMIHSQLCPNTLLHNPALIAATPDSVQMWPESSPVVEAHNHSIPGLPRGPLLHVKLVSPPMSPYFPSVSLTVTV